MMQGVGVRFPEEEPLFSDWQAKRIALHSQDLTPEMRYLKSRVCLRFSVGVQLPFSVEGCRPHRLHRIAIGVGLSGAVGWHMLEPPG